jgi:hypothetical protein
MLWYIGLPDVALASSPDNMLEVISSLGCVDAGVGEAVKVILLVAVTELLALLVAVRWYVPAVVEYSATVQGSFTTQGLVPTIVPPSVVHVTALLFTPVKIAVTVW